MSCCGCGIPPRNCDRVLPGAGVPAGSCGGWKPCPGQPCCTPTYRPPDCPRCDQSCRSSPLCIPIAYPCPRPCRTTLSQCGNASVTSWPPNYGGPPQNVQVNFNRDIGKRAGCLCSQAYDPECPKNCGCCGRQGPTIGAGCCGKAGDACNIRSPCNKDGLNYKDGCGQSPCKPCCPRPCCNPLPPCCLTIRPCEPKCCPSRCCKPPKICCPNPCDTQPDPRCCPKPMILSFRCPPRGAPSCPRDPCPQCLPSKSKS